MTKSQWIAYHTRLVETLIVDSNMSKGSVMYNDSVQFCNLIAKTFKIKTF